VSFSKESGKKIIDPGIDDLDLFVLFIELHIVASLVKNLAGPVKESLKIRIY